MKEVKYLNRKERESLSREELIQYYKDYKEYLSQCKYRNYSDRAIKLREKLNIIIKKILPFVIHYDVKIDGLENIPNGPVIYASTHQEFNDVTNCIYAIPEHVLTLNEIDVRPILKRVIDLNGVIWINRYDPSSTRDASVEILKALSKGKSINMYPEATWNCSPSRMTLPYHPGVIMYSQKSGLPIVPIVQEYTYDETILDGKPRIKSVHIVFGKPLYVGIDDDIEERRLDLMDEVRSIRWSLVEEKGMFSRKNISNELYANYKKCRDRDWRIPNNHMLTERKAIYGKDDEFYVFHPVNDIDMDENYNFLPTEHVKKLEEISRKHGIR